MRKIIRTSTPKPPEIHEKWTREPSQTPLQKYVGKKQPQNKVALLSGAHVQKQNYGQKRETCPLDHVPSDGPLRCDLDAPTARGLELKYKQSYGP